MSTPSVRASDADREGTARRLQQECAAGRLTPEELSDRLDRAFAARNLDELAELTTDLPAAPAEPAALARRRKGVAQQVGAAALQGGTPFVVCTLIWLFSGAGYFWPVWVLIPLVIRLMAVFRGDEHAHRHHGHRDRHERERHRGTLPPPPPPPPPGL